MKSKRGSLLFLKRILDKENDDPVEIFKFRDVMNISRNFAKFVLLVFSRNLNISRK